MTSQEYIIWLRGFVAASSNFNLTPEGWEVLKEKLNEVVGATPFPYYPPLDVKPWITPQDIPFPQPTPSIPWPQQPFKQQEIYYGDNIGDKPYNLFHTTVSDSTTGNSTGYPTFTTPTPEQ
jgi:hypothetical protein